MANHVTLERWTIHDLPVLERSNTPEMTAYLGGPESPEQLASRQARFLRLWEDGEARMFTVRVPAETVPVGSVGYWNKRWHDDDVYETGWSIATPYQGRGIATEALTACLDHAATNGNRRYVLAFPRIDNLASNALCRSTGFQHRGEEDFEYPAGNPIRVNVWSFDLDILR
jgi:RimJ/RimL family protein N-acetyltransferase